MSSYKDSFYDMIEAIYNAKFNSNDKCRDYREKEMYSKGYEEKEPCWYGKKRPPCEEEEKWVCKKEKFPCHEEKREFSCCDKPIFIENKLICVTEEKKQEEEKKYEDNGKMNENRRTEDLAASINPDGERELRRDVDAFAYLFLLSATGTTTVVPGADVPLNQSTVMDDVLFNPPAATVRIAGSYEIYYGVNLAAAVTTASFIALAINGVPQTGTFIPIPLGTIGEFSGKAILRLNRSDTLTIRNVPGGGAIVLAATPAVGAQLDLVLIDPAKREIG